MIKKKQLTGILNCTSFSGIATQKTISISHIDNKLKQKQYCFKSIVFVTFLIIYQYHLNAIYFCWVIFRSNSCRQRGRCEEFRPKRAESSALYAPPPSYTIPPWIAPSLSCFYRCITLQIIFPRTAFLFQMTKSVFTEILHGVSE